MYDVTAEQSFTAVRQWLTSIKVTDPQSKSLFSWEMTLIWTSPVKPAACSRLITSTAFQEGTGGEIPIMLLGNKTDKEAEREVQKEVGERLAKVLILNNSYKY